MRDRGATYFLLLKLPSTGIANTSYSSNLPELTSKNDEFSAGASTECEDASLVVASPHYKTALPYSVVSPVVTNFQRSQARLCRTDMTEVHA